MLLNTENYIFLSLEVLTNRARLQATSTKVNKSGKKSQILTGSLLEGFAPLRLVASCLSACLKHR